MKEEIRTDARAPYEPPAIEDVPLRPDELILAGCKSSPVGGAGPAGGFQPCSTCSGLSPS